MIEKTSADFKFNDEHCEKIKSELEFFATKITAINSDDSMPTNDEISNDDSLPINRQLKYFEMIKSHGNDSSSSLVPEQETISNEVDRYRKIIELNETDFKECSQLKFWEANIYNLPKLKQAARFYLSIPSTILPSVHLLRDALKQVKGANVKKAFFKNSLFATINGNVTNDGGDQINKSKESQGEYSGGVEKRPRTT